MARKKPKGQPHVRLYRYELETPAWRTLDPDARALLIELRGLYQPSCGNIVFMSVREGMNRLGIGQRRVQTAFAALIERGWISVETPGGFDRKTRHATSYRLANEAAASPGAVPSKAFMRWLSEPVARFSSVAEMTTDGSQNSYRRPSQKVENGHHGSHGSYREGDFRCATVAETATQIPVTNPRRVSNG